MTAPIFDPTYVKEDTIRCAGDESSRHPTIYLSLAKGSVVCPYCSRHFMVQPETTSSC